MERSEWHIGTPVRFASGRWELCLSRALRRERDGRSEFALPWSAAAPWPLTELFCFARAEEIGGRLHIIYAFDEKRGPIF